MVQFYPDKSAEVEKSTKILRLSFVSAPENFFLLPQDEINEKKNSFSPFKYVRVIEERRFLQSRGEKL